MRVVCISDTHLRHEQITIPDGDVLVHAGDSTMVGRDGDIIRFNHWLGTLPHSYKIIIAGNHDFLFESDPALAEGLITNAHYLRDSAVVIEGLKFYGSPWQPWFMDWAFNLQRGTEIKSKWDLIHEDTDVLVTHGPPHGILDLVPRDNLQGYEHIGCKDLLRAVRKVKPRLHIFGHIHEGYGVLRRSKTVYVNASVCDGAYRPVNQPLVVDLEI